MLIINWNDIANILTALVALAGLLLSIYNFIINNQEKKPKLRLTISQGGLTNGSSFSEHMIIINIANPGSKSVNVASLLMEINKKDTMLFKNIRGTKVFPFELHPGNSESFWFPSEEFKNEFKAENFKGKVNILFVCSDAVGNKYKKNYSINVDQ